MSSFLELSDSGDGCLSRRHVVWLLPTYACFTGFDYLDVVFVSLMPVILLCS